MISLKVISLIFATLATILGIVSLATSNNNLLSFMFISLGISRIIDDIGLYKQARRGLVIVNLILNALIIIFGIMMFFTYPASDM